MESCIGDIFKYLLEAEFKIKKKNKKIIKTNCNEMLH